MKKVKLSEIILILFTTIFIFIFNGCDKNEDPIIEPPNINWAEAIKGEWLLTGNYDNGLVEEVNDGSILRHFFLNESYGIEATGQPFQPNMHGTGSYEVNQIDSTLVTTITNTQEDDWSNFIPIERTYQVIELSPTHLRLGDKTYQRQ